MSAFVAPILKRLRNLTRLERRRVDVTLTRIQKKPALMFFFNAFLLTLNAFVRLKFSILRVLQSMGLASQVEQGLEAQQLIPSSMVSRSISDPLRVLLIVEDSIEQCFRYRVQQKLEQLALQQVPAEWISWREHAISRERIHFNDIIIFYRVPGFPDVLNTIRYARAINKVVVYDVDDLVFDREQLGEKFKHHSGQLRTHERNALLKGARLYQSALRECEFAVTTTASLKSEIEKLVGKGKVFVLPNGVDTLVTAAADGQRVPKSTEFIDVFYGSGTKTHDEDFALVSGVLERLLLEYDRIRLVVAGYLTLPETLTKYGDRVVKIPLMPFDSYLAVLSAADINIAPLEAGVFADCKSEIKWLEAGVLGVPSVVSATSTYNRAINHGVDGFIAADTEGWYECLQKLIDDETLRREVGRRAGKSAREKYGLSALSQNLAEIIHSLVQQSIEIGTLSDGPRERRRILFVNTVYPPHAVGGATVVMKKTIDDLRENYANEFEILVFTCDGENPIPYQLHEYAWEDVLVTALSMPTHPDLEWKYEDAKACELFRDYLEYQKPDLVHFHSIQRLTGSVLQATYEAGIPFFVTVHDAWWLSDHQFLLNEEGRVVNAQQLNPIVAASTSKDIVGSIARTRYLTKQLTHSAQLLAVSEYQADLYKKNGFSRITVNKNGVKPFSDMNMKSVATGKLRLGYVGGLCAHKGYYFLQQAVEELMLENLELHIVDFDLASGERRNERWGGTDIRFSPKMPAERMHEFYQDIEILVAPSLWPESFGLVTREAMLMGRWVVASDAGGLAEDLQSGLNSHIFDPGDMKALKTILAELNTRHVHYQQAIPLSVQTKSNVPSVSEQVAQLVALYYSELSDHSDEHNESKQVVTSQVV